MKRHAVLAALLVACLGCPSPPRAGERRPEPPRQTRSTPKPEPSRKTPPAPPRGRGHALARHGRPEHFPHRIWAFSDFEARPAGFGWFGAAETTNIPKYPGNRTARRGTGPWKKFAALRTGMNPVPGPRMGKVNKLYVRYFIQGIDRALFQCYGLTSGDSCHIRVSGLRRGTWSEMVLNFTRDSRRNDGSPGAFKEGERMGDLQVYVGKPGQEGRLEIIIDDPILFADDPDLPPEPEPFPRRVLFLAAFDTGIGPASRARYYPGRFEPAAAAKSAGITARAPKGSYWVVAKAVTVRDAGIQQVHLVLKPPRPVGPNTKLRFRYWVNGADKIAVLLHDATAGRMRAAAVERCKQARWVTRYVTFSRNEKAVGGGRFPAGNKVDSLAFIVPAGEAVKLFIDEVVLFDAAPLGAGPK